MATPDTESFKLAHVNLHGFTASRQTLYQVTNINRKFKNNTQHYQRFHIVYHVWGEIVVIYMVHS